MSTIASHSPLNISETVRDRGLVPMANGPRGIKWSRDRWRHMTPKGQTQVPNALRAQHLENSCSCYLATTIANYYTGSLLCGSIYVCMYVCMFIRTSNHRCTMWRL